MANGKITDVVYFGSDRESACAPVQITLTALG